MRRCPFSLTALRAGVPTCPRSVAPLPPPRRVVGQTGRHRHGPTSSLNPVLDALHDRSIFRRVFSVALKIMAVGAGLGTSVSVVAILGVVFNGRCRAVPMLG